MLTKEYGIFFYKYYILFCKYFHEHHAYDKINTGSMLCANVQSLVTKQPILSQNEAQSKRKRPKFLIALGDFL